MPLLAYMYTSYAVARGHHVEALTNIRTDPPPPHTHIHNDTYIHVCGQHSQEGLSGKGCGNGRGWRAVWDGRGE